MVEPLLLAAWLALGTPPAPPPIPLPPPPPDGADAEAPPVVPTEEAAEPPASENPTLLEYQFSQVERAPLGDGPTRVVVESGAAAPHSGSSPVRVTIDNAAGPAQEVQLAVTAIGPAGRRLAERTVAVEAGERRVVTLPVLAGFSAGHFTARGPGIKGNARAFVRLAPTWGEQKAVLSLSEPRAFQDFVGTGPRYGDALVQVVAVPPTEAPAELASLAGFDLVVAPSPRALEALDPAAQRALEAWVATGGSLLVAGPVRALPGFPLLVSPLPPEPGWTRAYGFGRLTVAGGHVEDPHGLFRPVFPVQPRGVANSGFDRESSDLLLPQAVAPVGRFLLIIAAFSLLIGPGSAWVARRRGPAALLVTIPGTAAVTCLVIVGYSLWADGFTVHASSHGYTRLDRVGRRAITLGVTGYYANLAPSRATFSTGTAVSGPVGEGYERPQVGLLWQEGLVLGSDFLPSRTYREWGFLSVEPTRARVQLRRDGEVERLQNGLGVDVAMLCVAREGGEVVAYGPVKDGAEAGPRESGCTFQLPADRFGARLPGFDAASLRPGQFLAQVDGAGFVPRGGLEVERHGGVHLVLGEVEP